MDHGKKDESEESEDFPPVNTSTSYSTSQSTQSCSCSSSQEMDNANEENTNSHNIKDEDKRRCRPYDTNNHTKQHHDPTSIAEGRRRPSDWNANETQEANHEGRLVLEEGRPASASASASTSTSQKKPMELCISNKDTSSSSSPSSSPSSLSNETTKRDWKLVQAQTSRDGAGSNPRLLLFEQDVGGNSSKEQPQALPKIKGPGTIPPSSSAIKPSLTCVAQLTMQQKIMLAENQKNHGRRGDPRMNKAVTTKLENPNITLFQALTAGGFDFPCDEKDSTGNGPVYDADRISLSQRKNQLSRRLRLLSRKSQRILELRRQHSRGGSMTEDKRKSLISPSRQLRPTFSSSCPSGPGYASRRGIHPHPSSYGHGANNISAYAGEARFGPYSQSVNQQPSSLQAEYMQRRMNLLAGAGGNYAAMNHHRRQQQESSFPPPTTTTTTNNGNATIKDVLLENQILRDHLKKNNEMFQNQVHRQHQQLLPPHLLGNVSPHAAHYSSYYGHKPQHLPPPHPQFASSIPITEQQQQQQQQVMRNNHPQHLPGAPRSSSVNSLQGNTMITSNNHSKVVGSGIGIGIGAVAPIASSSSSSSGGPTSHEEKRRALINAGFKENEITEELINEFQNKLEKVQGKFMTNNPTK